MRRHFPFSDFRLLGADLPKNIVTLLWAIFIFCIAWGAIEPFIPLYIKTIVPNYTLVGIVFALFNFFVFLMSMPIGDLADKAKPVKIIRIALLVYPLIGLFYFASSKFWHLAIARIIHGVNNPGLWVSAEAFIRQNTTKENSLKAFGWYSTTINFGIVTGAIIGAGLIAFFTFNQLFLLLVPVSIISLLLFLKVKHMEKEEGFAQAIEEIVEKDRVFEKEIKDFAGLGKNGLILAILIFFTAIMTHIIYFVIPLISVEIKINLVELALLYGLLHVPFMFCFALTGIADKKGKIQIIQTGFFLMAIALGLTFFVLESLPLFVIMCFMLAFIIALVLPSINSLISDITPNAEIGEITGAYYGMYFLGGIAGPISFGIIGDLFGLKTVFLASAAIAAIVFLITFAYRKKIVDKIEPVPKKTLRIILEEAKTP